MVNLRADDITAQDAVQVSSTIQYDMEWVRVKGSEDSDRSMHSYRRMS